LTTEKITTAFEVVNLNLNHEPILLTTMALYGIVLILDQVKFKYLQGGPSKRTAAKILIYLV